MEYLPTDCFIENNNIITTSVVGGLLLLSLILNIIQCKCTRSSSTNGPPDMESGSAMQVPIVRYPSPVTPTRRDFELSKITRNFLGRS